MGKRTYLNASVKNGCVMRWPITNFVVHIAPMKFYSKQGQDEKYRGMVHKAFSEWSAATGGRLQFKFTNVLLESNINVEWKRVERKALGHCTFSWDSQGRLYGAEISIGLSDGLIHQIYDNETETYHTILHEVGHSLGLGHSPYETDIMFTPHQYGISSLSTNDKYSIQWLYRLPLGVSVKQIAEQHSIITTTDIDSVISKIDAPEQNKEEKRSHMKIATKRNLLDEATHLGNLNRYNILLQDVGLSPKVKSYLNNNRNS